MVPLRCDTPQRRLSPATILLIVICCLVYLLQGRWQIVSTGFVPLEFTHSILHPGASTINALATCCAAFFMHANLLHLVSNMWYLWIFGSAVEYRLGFLRFVGVYLICGGISMFVQAVFSPLSLIPIVGASGAIAGIMGIHFLLLPMSRILVWIPPIFFVKIHAFVFLLLWFYVQYAGAGDNGDVRVAWWAHIGGFVAGAGWGTYLRIRGVPEGKKQKTSRRR